MEPKKKWKKQGWIGVDLDGTLAYYDKWDGGRIGAPIPEMVERVKKWLADGQEVRIFTARISDMEPKVWQDIQAWVIEHIGEPLEITNVKDYSLVELWDDRAVQVEKNTGRPVGYSTRGL